MTLNNLRVTVQEVGEEHIVLETEQKNKITIPKELMPEAVVGLQLFIAADTKPLTGSEKQAKDILNEIIKD